ncbi:MULTISPECIES: hypothetical protein [Pseudonocardiaceae]|nr:MULTISPECIES: hypothetical protein [Pseudonocardiaceae]MBE1579536.1 hypothetical protein [Amycolatopsis roodepoortensis]
MPLFSDIDGPAPEGAAEATVGQVVGELTRQARAGHVVYLTGPGDDDVVAVAPVDVVKAGLAALGRTEDGTRL